MADHKWWTLTVVALATFMLLLDITIVNVALPSIERELHASFSDLQWVVDAYALTLSVLLLVSGSVADRVGRRMIFVGGLVIFSCASLLCGLALNPFMLSISRAAQGVGGAMMFSTTLALIAQSFRGKERAVAFGVLGAVTGGAVAIGPLLGGILTQGLGWRSIFLVNVPVGVIAVVMTLRNVQETKDPTPHGIDWLGAVLFSGSLFLFVIGLIRGNADGWTSPLILSLLIGSGVLMIAFVFVELRQKSPLFDLSLFRKPAFCGVSSTAFLLSASMFAMFLYITLYLQNILGLEPPQGRTWRCFPSRPVVLRGARRRPAVGKGASQHLPQRRHAARVRRACSHGACPRRLLLERAAGGLRSCGNRDRHDQPTLVLCGDRGRPPCAKRDGVRHQRHVPPGRYRDRDRGTWRHLPDPAGVPDHVRAAAHAPPVVCLHDRARVRTRRRAQRARSSPRCHHGFGRSLERSQRTRSRQD